MRIGRRAIASGLLLLALPAAAQQHDYSEGGADACLECHESEKIMGIFETPHMDESDPDSPAARKQCESCHGPSATHMRFPMQVGNIRFTKHDATTPVARRNQACLECHSDGLRDDWQHSPHGFENVACVDCHVIHKVRDPILSKAEQNQLCTESCHKDILTTAPKPSHHPLTGKDAMPCTDCHNPHGPLDLGTCNDCHAQTPETWAKESEKARGYHRRAAQRNIPCTSCHKAFVHAMPVISVKDVKLD